MPDAPHRKELRRRENPCDSRFITFSCYQRLPLLHHPAIMDLFAATLADARRQHAFALYAWVIMPEHVHLLLRPAPTTAWADIALSLKVRIARRVLGRWRELEAPILNRLCAREGETRFWQHGGGFDRNIRDEEEFCKTVTYIHCNPVERGLVETAPDWKWSSVRWWIGHRDGELECDPSPGWERGLRLWKGFM